jgi:hypothetical protein
MEFKEENDYIFTKEAYNKYKSLTFSLKKSFWDHFHKERYIGEGGIIFHFMFALWLWKLGEVYRELVFDYTDILKEIISNKGNIDITRVFSKSSFIYFRDKEFSLEYDLEYAEYIFASYEKYSDIGNNFGLNWWNKYNEILKLIHTFVQYK